MEAVILVGGLGTRLQEVVPDVPKPLASIRGTPFLSLLLKNLPFERVILAVGHRADQIISCYQNHPFPFDIQFSVESEPLGTGGALIHALSMIKGPLFWVLNGDSYFAIDFEKMEEAHLQTGADLTIASLEVEEVSRYGSLEFDPSTRRITHFSEKAEKKGAGWISGGIYLFQKEVLSCFSLKSFSLEKEGFPHLLNKRCFMYPSRGAFIDIGTKESYSLAQDLLIS